MPDRAPPQSTSAPPHLTGTFAPSPRTATAATAATAATRGLIPLLLITLLTPHISGAATPTSTATSPRGKKQPPSTTTSISAWQEAVNAFKYQDFDAAIPRLRKLIYPKTKLDRAREWTARTYLAAALWWSGKKQPALDEFTALLVRNPQAHLDPAYYPPQMIKDFEQLRSNLIRLGVIKRDQKALAPKHTVGIHAPSPVLAYFPFGVGQFANHRNVKGALFLGVEALLAGASTILYTYNRDAGLAGRADRLPRVGQLSTAGAFWAVAIWGVVDAVMERRALKKKLQRQAQHHAP